MPEEGNESRVRVAFNLPLNNWKQEHAVNDVIAYLQDQQLKQLGVDGFTHSDKTPPVFAGYWWDSEEKQWVDDRLVIVMVDYLAPSASKQYSVYEEIAKLKETISATYARRAGAEKEVWIVSHGVMRQK